MKTIHNTLPDPSGRYIFHQPVDQITFFDIETTGLSSKTASIYLIGAMHYNCPTGSWELTQWFADDYQSEPDILEAFLSYLKDFSYLYHFNGCTFDIPFITAKCKKHGILPSQEISDMLKNVISSRSSEPAPANIDLLKEIRPLKKRLGLEKANQSYLERWVGLNREDIYNGGQLIKVYSEYMQQKILHKEKGTELKKLLLLHNHDDIAGMIHVCSMLAYQDFFSPAEPAPVTVTHQSDFRVAGSDSQKNHFGTQLFDDRCSGTSTGECNPYVGQNCCHPVTPSVSRISQIFLSGS